jgi:hypothetical protein
MKKIILCSFAAISGCIAQAQLILNVQLPATGIFVKSQLWNFSIINTSGQSMNLKIEMTFSDASTNQRIFTASSRVFQLSQQVTQLQSSNLTPIIYNIVNSSYNIDINPDGFLPVGNFEVCFALLQLNGEATDRLTEECETIQVEPLSPPILLDSPDEGSIDMTRPFFTWIPPSPVIGFYNLTYNWVLVELQGNQNAADAIQQNLPLYAQQNLPVNSMAYPGTLPELDTAKTYAWQVSANSSNNAIAKSEIWTFRIKKYAPEPPAAPSGTYYVPLKKDAGASYSTHIGTLRFQHLNELNDTIAHVRFYDLSVRTAAPIIPQEPIRMKPGQNFIDLDLSAQGGITNKHIYLMEFLNRKNEKWFLKFEYLTPGNN